MKDKQRIDLIVGLILILNAIVILLMPLFNINDIKLLSVISFTIISVINFCQFILTKESKDYESLLTFIASIISLIVFSTLDITNKPKSLAISLMIWISLMAVIKLKKADYYHDRNDRMWKIKVLSLVLFVISGILSSINLAYDSSVQIIVLGFFLFIHGILEFIEPVVKTLIKHS